MHILLMDMGRVNFRMDCFLRVEVSSSYSYSRTPRARSLCIDAKRRALVRQITYHATI
jgi:hypothetical protein